MIEPTADGTAQRFWNVYLKTISDASNPGVAESAYLDYTLALDQSGIIPTYKGYAYRCVRCEGMADRLVNTRNGVDKLCNPCAVVVLADVQCRGIPQPTNARE